MASRQQNERKFGRWEISANGSRRYWREVVGRAGGRAFYFKEVAADERTTRFWQEVRDATGRLVALHEKFPVDGGHQIL